MNLAIEIANAKLLGERFFLLSEDVVVDTEFMIMWQRRMLDGIQRDWKDAKLKVSNVVLNGYKDWRLPTSKELRSLLVPNPLFKINMTMPSIFQFRKVEYWTCHKIGIDYVKTVHLSVGINQSDTKSLNYTTCVRKIKKKELML